MEPPAADTILIAPHCCVWSYTQHSGYSTSNPCSSWSVLLDPARMKKLRIRELRGSAQGCPAKRCGSPKWSPSPCSYCAPQSPSRSNARVSSKGRVAVEDMSGDEWTMEHLANITAGASRSDLGGFLQSDDSLHRSCLSRPPPGSSLLSSL